MGRDFLSATELVHQIIADLKPLTEMLPRQDRLIFAKFTETALNSQAAILNRESLLSLEATLLILLLEEHKRTQQLYGELCAEIERLKMTAERLGEFALVDNTSS